MNDLNNKKQWNAIFQTKIKTKNKLLKHTSYRCEWKQWTTWF
jgi:hypothetical protein